MTTTSAFHQSTCLQHNGQLSTFQEVSNFTDQCDGSLIVVRPLGGPHACCQLLQQ